MKFKQTITCQATLRKQKEYDFKFSKEDIKKGMNATYKKPHIIVDGFSIKALYKNKEGFLSFNYFTSYNGFEDSNTPIKQPAKKISKKKKLSQLDQYNKR